MRYDSGHELASAVSMEFEVCAFWRGFDTLVWFTVIFSSENGNDHSGQEANCIK
jgi:hypothetical protein